jgi:hypothetical protein
LPTSEPGVPAIRGMGAMEIDEMVILDDGFRILFFLEERLSSLHDDVGVVVLFDRIA